MKSDWIWDKWQQDLIDYEGSVTIRKGRQVGCSTTAGKRRAKLMLKYVGSKSLIIAPAKRQGSELFIKVLSWIELRHQEVLAECGGFKADPRYSIKRNLELKRQFEYDHGIYNELPTKTTIVLKRDFKKPQGLLNIGSECWALPAGKTGVYLRAFALDFLDIDEAAYVPETVYNAVKPMLAVSEKKKGLGWEMFLSTPFGYGGFFHDSHFSDDYRKWHIDSEDCRRISKKFLKKERARLTKAEYAQEWKGEFVEEWHQFFPTALIKQCMTFLDWGKAKDYDNSAHYYYGLDPARYGGDEIAGVIVEEKNRRVKAVKCIVEERKSTTHTVGSTCVYDDTFNFRRIFTDDGGLGGAVTDQLIEKLGKRKIVALNNSSKRIEIHGEEKKAGILKEDLYSNTLKLMETGKLELINNLKLMKSMKSVTYEYTSDKNLKIYGKYTHLAEALVRACWCVKDRGLNLYVY